MKSYVRDQYPKEAGQAALRFIDDNFRKQAWEGIAWKRRRGKGKRNAGRALLIDRGILRRGNKAKYGPGQAMVYNYVKYAAVNNNGFNGTVSVPAHNRRLYGKFRVSSVKTQKATTKRLERGTVLVKEHSRKMRIPRRQFMPTLQRPSPTLNKIIDRKVNLAMYKILKANS